MRVLPRKVEVSTRLCGDATGPNVLILVAAILQFATGERFGEVRPMSRKFHGTVISPSQVVCRLPVKRAAAGESGTPPRVTQPLPAQYTSPIRLPALQSIRIACSQRRHPQLSACPRPLPETELRISV